MATNCRMSPSPTENPSSHGWPGTKTQSCGSLCSSAIHASPETALIFPAANFTANGYAAENLIQSASLLAEGRMTPPFRIHAAGAVSAKSSTERSGSWPHAVGGEYALPSSGSRVVRWNLMFSAVKASELRPLRSKANFQEVFDIGRRESAHLRSSTLLFRRAELWDAELPPPASRAELLAEIDSQLPQLPGEFPVEQLAE